jgi:hypothetical protein
VEWYVKNALILDRKLTGVVAMRVADCLERLLGMHSGKAHNIFSSTNGT